MNLSITDITATNATLSWEPPANDGGTPVTGYHVERCVKDTERWVRQTRAPVTETAYMDEKLMEGSIYQYRAVAINKRGESVPSEPTEPFTAKNPYG